MRVTPLIFKCWPGVCNAGKKVTLPKIFWWCSWGSWSAARHTCLRKWGPKTGVQVNDAHYRSGDGHMRCDLYFSYIFLFLIRQHYHQRKIEMKQTNPFQLSSILSGHDSDVRIKVDIASNLWFSKQYHYIIDQGRPRTK